MHVPTVSVIVPSYRHRRFLPARIASILSQSFRDIEIIILDDASDDGTVEWLEAQEFDVPTRIFVNESRVGSPVEQWAKGLALATGEYVWIAEGDDMARPGFLETMVALLNGRRDLGMAFCESLVINKRGAVVDCHRRRTGPVWTDGEVVNGRLAVSRALSVRNTIPNVSACVFRREVFANPDWKHARLRLCGDWYAYAQIMRTWSVCYIKAELNQHRIHGGSVRASSGRTWLALEETYSVLNWIHANFRESDRLLEEARATQFDSFLYVLDVMLSRNQAPTDDLLRAALEFDPHFIQRLATNRPPKNCAKHSARLQIKGVRARTLPHGASPSAVHFRLPYGLVRVLGATCQTSGAIVSNISLSGLLVEEGAWKFTVGDELYIYSPDGATIGIISNGAASCSSQISFVSIELGDGIGSIKVTPGAGSRLRRRLPRPIRVALYYIDSKIGHRIHYFLWRFLRPTSSR